MFNKEGIPFFIIIIPFLSIVFLSFFTTSYHMKITEETMNLELKAHQSAPLWKTLSLNEQEKSLQEIKEHHAQQQQKYIHFAIVITVCILLFIVFFSFVMISIVHEVVQKYIDKVNQKEKSLNELNENLATQVAMGIEKGKQQDKAILRQSRQARMGSMISMIAHQWRQPLSELSGVLMELEMATRLKKANEEHILSSIDRSDALIEYMSKTIDDFRNFYKPDKTKERFSIYEACQKALQLIDPSLKHSEITCNVVLIEDKQITGYPNEYAQVILNIISNAKDILIERSIFEPQITVRIDSRRSLSVVTIQDNGGGIEASMMERIFDPYFTTKDTTKGTGLGLYISQLIIEKNMYGDLSVANDDVGAVFTIIVQDQL